MKVSRRILAFMLVFFMALGSISPIYAQVGIEKSRLGLDQENKNIGKVEESKDSMILSKTEDKKEYRVSVQLLNENEDKPSMAATAILSPATITVEQGRAIARLETQPMVIAGIEGQLTELKILTGDVGMAEKENATFIFEVPMGFIENTTDVLVEMSTDRMPFHPKARLRFDNPVLQVPELNKTPLENKITQAEGIEKGKKSQEAFDRLKKAIEEAKSLLSTASEQGQLDQEVGVLDKAITSFENSEDVVVPELNKTPLENKITQAEGIEQGKKSQEAFNKLQGAITSAKNTLKGAKDQASLDQGLDLLTKAISTFNQSQDMGDPTDPGEVKEYRVAVQLLKEKEDKPSMAAAAILSPAVVTVQGEKTSVALQTQPLNFQGIQGNLTKLKILTGKQAVAEKHGSSFIFEAPSSLISRQTDVLVEMSTDIMPTEQVARLRFNGKALPAEELNKAPLENKITQAEGIEQGKKSQEAFNKLQGAITSAKNILKGAKDQASLDQGLDLLTKAISTFNQSQDMGDPTDPGEVKEYRVAVQLLKEKEDKPSMAAAAILSPAVVTVQGEKTSVTLQTQPLNFQGIQGNLTKLKILTGKQAVAEKHGSSFVFEAPSSLISRQTDVLVEMSTDIMPTEQVARLRFNGKALPVDEENNRKEDLKELIDKSEKLLKKDYSVETWEKFILALENAKLIYGDKSATEDQITSAKKNLEEAKKNLKKEKKEIQGNKKIFTVPVSLTKVGGGESMASSALYSQAKVIQDEEGKFTYFVTFQTMKKNFAGKDLQGNVTKLFYFDGKKQEANNEGDGVWSFKLNSKINQIKIAIWVDVMDEIMGGGLGSGEQEAQLNFDWKHVQEEIKEDRKHFVDTVGHWAAKAIEYGANKGYFKGVGNNQFAPDRAMTRGEFVTVLGRIQKVNKIQYSKNIFKDVGSGKYYDEYVNWAFEKGLIKGMGYGEFKPDQTLTREQMAVIISNYIKMDNISLPNGEVKTFTDEREISSWAKIQVAEMQKMGVIKGMEDGSFRPKSAFTRAQIAQVLFNIDRKNTVGRI